MSHEKSLPQAEDTKATKFHDGHEERTQERKWYRLNKIVAADIRSFMDIKRWSVFDRLLTNCLKILKTKDSLPQADLCGLDGTR